MKKTFNLFIYITAITLVILTLTACKMWEPNDYNQDNYESVFAYLKSDLESYFASEMPNVEILEVSVYQPFRNLTNCLKGKASIKKSSDYGADAETFNFFYDSGNDMLYTDSGDTLKRCIQIACDMIIEKLPEDFSYSNPTLSKFGSIVKLKVYNFDNETGKRLENEEVEMIGNMLPYGVKDDELIEIVKDTLAHSSKNEFVAFDCNAVAKSHISYHFFRETPNEIFKNFPCIDTVDIGFYDLSGNNLGFLSSFEDDRLIEDSKKNGHYIINEYHVPKYYDLSKWLKLNGYDNYYYNTDYDTGNLVEEKEIISNHNGSMVEQTEKGFRVTLGIYGEIFLLTEVDSNDGDSSGIPLEAKTLLTTLGKANDSSEGTIFQLIEEPSIGHGWKRIADEDGSRKTFSVGTYEFTYK
ncbi:hypothetical protein HMPREF9628_00728 [Peptoanaerobacter stomatis]|uniref:Lipoprotein n=1 Tax=Peptoanaerobacter stomatis TaxID=796937 RepID=G9XFR2_9FIRM|nr:hypothetical protein [Peptoanaerobacter stomatis]EHL15805.1 hypothetical protein HMPREF9628_00728 [Peptoanaerobacter stomatis]